MEAVVGAAVGGVLAILGRLMIAIEYRVRTTNTFYNLVYPFYLQEGGREFQ